MDPSEIEDLDKWEDNDHPSGQKLDGDIEAIDIVAFGKNGVDRATGGIQHHRTRANTWDNTEYEVQPFGKLRLSFEPSDPDDLLVELRAGDVHYVEVALEKEGPEDSDREQTKGRKIRPKTIERIRRLYGIAVADSSLLDAIINVTQQPFARQARKGINIENETLDQNNTRVEDLRVGTITTFHGWNHAIRNIRFFIGPQFLLVLYGPIEDNDWQTDAKRRLHHLTVLDSNVLIAIRRARIETPRTEGYAEELFKEAVKSIVGQSMWCIDVASREGIAVVEQRIFREVALNKRNLTPMGPYWDDIAGVGAAVYRIVETENTLRNRFVRGGDGTLPFTQSMEKECNDLKSRIREVRQEIREHYHLLGAISQQQQVNRLQASSTRDQIFQISLGSLASFVGFSSLVVALYAANQNITDVPGPVPVTFGLVVTISFCFIGLFFALVLILMASAHFSMLRDERRAKPLRQRPSETEQRRWRRNLNRRVRVLSTALFSWLGLTANR